MPDDGFIEIGFMLHCAVYALLHRREVVYIGKSKKPLTRLYTHAHGRGKLEPWRAEMTTRRKGFNFTDIWIRPCMLNELDQLEAQMIRKYQPKYNIRGKPVAQITTMPESIREMITQLSGTNQQTFTINRRGF